MARKYLKQISVVCVAVIAAIILWPIYGPRWRSITKKYSVTKRLPDIGPLEPGQLIFSEEFNEIDFKMWQPVITMSGCGSGEFQIYDKHKKNIFVRNGVLHIQPTLTEDRFGRDFLYNGNLVLPNCTDPLFNGCNKTAGRGNILNPVISGRLRTMKSFSFIYGKVEARAKIPAGDWLWPAIWMNPTFMKYGTWPMSGEVDIMESRGNRKLFNGKKNVGVEQVSSALHFGPTRTQDKWRKARASKNIDEGFDTDFHRFQLNWTPEKISFGVDDKVLKVIKPPSKGGMFKFGGFKGENIWKDGTNPVMAPFDQYFYLLINVAVGGQTGYFNPRSLNIPYRRPWSNFGTLERAMVAFWGARKKWYPTWRSSSDGKSSSAFQIDYIRVWAI